MVGEIMPVDGGCLSDSTGAFDLSTDQTHWLYMGNRIWKIWEHDTSFVKRGMVSPELFILPCCVYATEGFRLLREALMPLRALLTFACL